MKAPYAAGCIAWLGALILASLGGSAPAQDPDKGPQRLFGPAYRSNPRAAEIPAVPAIAAGPSFVARWNQIALDASGLDHTPVAAGESRAYGEQLGPCRASRALAVIQIAVFEAVNSISRDHRGYLGIAPAPAATSRHAAVAQAAHDTLVAMFPSQAANFDAYLAADLATLRAGNAKSQGIKLGHRAAAAIIALRAGDGSDHEEPRYGIDYLPSNAVGSWQQDPVSQSPIALGARWNQVTPFVMESALQFRLPPPPPLDGMEQALAFVEVKRLGGDGVTTPTERTVEQTKTGNFWAYDGTPGLCAPPRLYNQLARTIATAMGSGDKELARLLALVNVAMADAAIAAWDSKYHYAVARPVTLIRQASADGNEDTVANPAFTPLGAPASNLTGPNFTPPFPAYPSGHATFGGALFQVLRRFYGRDDIAFTFVSDEYNGHTLDNAGQLRPLVPRSFNSLFEAERENAESRIYLGIHWAYDATRGIEQGRKVGDHVFDRLYQPLRRGGR